MWESHRCVRDRLWNVSTVGHGGDVVTSAFSQVSTAPAPTAPLIAIQFCILQLEPTFHKHRVQYPTPSRFWWPSCINFNISDTYYSNTLSTSCCYIRQFRISLKEMITSADFKSVSPSTDRWGHKRFKEVQSVLVVCFSTTLNGPDGFLFFPSWLYFNAYMHLFQKHEEHKLRWAQGSFLQVIQKYVDAIGGHRFSEGTSADSKIQRTLMEVGVYSFFLIHIMILWWGRYISYVGKIKKKKLCHL